MQHPGAVRGVQTPGELDGDVEGTFQRLLWTAIVQPAKVTLYTDGKKVGEGDIPATLAMVFSADDGLDVGEDSGAPVSPDYGSVGNGFNGTVKGALLSIEEEKGAHLVDPAKAVQIALARQ